MDCKFTFKRVKENEIARVMDIINDAKALLKNTSKQWQNGYPNEASMRQDIKNGYLFGIYEEAELLAISAMILDEDENYSYIEDGAWQIPSSSSDLVVHRVAVKKEHYRRSLAKKMLECAKEYARENGCKSIKMDTHKDNIPMRRLLEGEGFSYRGIIYIKHDETNNARVAYEFII